MVRIENAMRSIENQLVYISSDESLTQTERAQLLPVLESHLETINRWKLARFALSHIPGGEQ